MKTIDVRQSKIIKDIIQGKLNRSKICTKYRLSTEEYFQYVGIIHYHRSNSKESISG